MKNFLSIGALVAAAFIAIPTSSALAASAIDCSVFPYCQASVVVPALTVDASLTSSKPALAEVIIDIDEPLPASISLPHNGGAVMFTRKLRPNTTEAKGEIENTDGIKDPLLVSTTPLPDAPKGYEVISQFKANRPGQGKVVVTHTVIRPDAVPYSETIKVIVR